MPYEKIRENLSVGKHREAIKDLKLIVKKEKCIDSLYMLGVAYFKLKQYGQSRLYFLDCLRLNDSQKDARYYLAILYEKIGRDDLSLLEYKKIYDIDPCYKEVREKLGYPNEKVIDKKSSNISEKKSNLLFQGFKRFKSHSMLFCFMIMMSFFQVLTFLVCIVTEGAITEFELFLIGGEFLSVILSFLYMEISSSNTLINIYKHKLKVQRTFLNPYVKEVHYRDVTSVSFSRNIFNFFTGDSFIRITYKNETKEEEIKISGLGNKNEMLKIWEDMCSCMETEKENAKIQILNNKLYTYKNSFYPIES